MSLTTRTGSAVTILDSTAVDRALTRIAHEMREQNADPDQIALVGVRTRGLPIAQRLAAVLQRITGAEVPVGVIDVSPYRDDVSKLAAARVVDSSQIGFDVTGLTIILIDDVLCTGRTARAALDALLDRGRPSRVQLAVLVDRGHRDLPIRPDYVGRNQPTVRTQEVRVQLQETDGVDQVLLWSDKES